MEIVIAIIMYGDSHNAIIMSGDSHCHYNVWR